MMTKIEDELLSPPETLFESWVKRGEQLIILRQALEAVEWATDENGRYCPWCNRILEDGHSPDCLRQRALGLDKEQK